MWQWPYSAFGDEEPTTAAKRFTGPNTVPTTGTTTATPVVLNLRFPGQYFDSESGLHYNGHRTYNPTTGRYTQNDPIGLDGGWNGFAYVDADPLNYVDPDGLVKLPGNPRDLQLLEGGGGGGGIGGPTTSGPSPFGGGGLGRGGGFGRSGGGNGGPPDSALVCRGGACKAESFSGGSGVSRASDGTLNGVSTQCKPGTTVEELSRAFRHNQVGVTNVGNIRASGGRVTLDGTPANPNHATVNGLTPQQLERLFTPTVPNPIPPAQRR